MQTSLAQSSSSDEGSHGRSRLGPILCWAVVFADIGSSIYYIPGIMYKTVGGMAGFFVLLTMGAFVLLALKYAEVSDRFPAGGGVVSVAAQAINSWAGALGGMLILVSYFLTAAISSLSAIKYLSVVITTITPSTVLLITIGVLVLLGLLNWVGISESAKVSLIGAVLSFVSNIVVLVTVFLNVPLNNIIELFSTVLQNETPTPWLIVVGFAGAFLAFSGLESISQLSPVMRTPRKKVISLALLMVVLSIALTSPLLTLFSTLLQRQAAGDEILSGQLISLLGGLWGNTWLQTEVAISATLILIFAANTAIIGAYHVFMALARMEFFPMFILKRNKFRDTPHYSIILATGIPVIVLILVNGDIDILGHLYVFGLLGAFTLTCLGLDLIRYRERKAARIAAREPASTPVQQPLEGAFSGLSEATRAAMRSEISIPQTTAPVRGLRGIWSTLDFWLGILTTLLVGLAWGVNIISQPQSVLFGGTATLFGMLVAFIIYAQRQRQGYTPVVVTGIHGHLPAPTMAIMMAGNAHNEAVARSAIIHAEGKPVVFLFIGKEQPVRRHPRTFEIVDPYLEDAEAKKVFGKTENLARKARVARRFVYQQSMEAALYLWKTVHPHDVVTAAENVEQLKNINPDRIRFEITADGKVAHLLKRW